MKRREFLKSLLGVSMLPFLPCGFAIARESSREELRAMLPSDPWEDDIFEGISVDCMGRQATFQEVEWDEDLKPTRIEKYFVYRFHLSKNLEYLNDPDKFCYEAFAELDCALVDAFPQDTKINLIIDELRIYAENIQEATRRGT